MKRFVLFLLIMVMCFMFVGCSSQSNYSGVSDISEETDYSGVSDIPEETDQEKFLFTLPEWLVWEMKEGEVRKNLSVDLDEYGNIIYFFHEEKYKSCIVMETYGFTDDNKLIHLSYSFSDWNFTDESNTYYEVYTECKENLITILGEPTGETEEWKNDRYKDDEYMMYKAIEDGDYTALTAWDLEEYICYIQIDEGVEINYEAKKQ